MTLSLYNESDVLIDRLIAGSTVPGEDKLYATSLSTNYLGSIEPELVSRTEAAFKNIRVE